MCNFTVLPSDDYVLQLHFEQVHTTDSPFRIEHDSMRLPTLPSGPSSEREDTPSSDEEEEETVACPEPDCGELVLLIDFNDHLDYHTAESLSFDDTGKYTHHSSATMQGSSTANSSSRMRHAKDALESNSNTELPNAFKHGGPHKLKKHSHRDRRGSEKSTLSRSINAFNPFVKFDKAVKPPIKSARLGVSVCCLFRLLSEPSYHRSFVILTVFRNPSSDRMPGRAECLPGSTTNSRPAPRSLSPTALAEMAASSNRSRFKTRPRVLYPSSLSYLLSIVPCNMPTTAIHLRSTLARLPVKEASAAIGTFRCCSPTFKARKLRAMKSFLDGRLVS
jgi:hypothetical protein